VATVEESVDESGDKHLAATGGRYFRQMGPYLFLSILLAFLITLAARSELVPYNIRELLDGGSSFAISIGLVLAICLAFGPPAWMGVNLARQPLYQAWRFPFNLILQSLIVYIGLRVVAPLESIHDILGTPVLSWPPEMERLARFIGLFGTISVLLSGGAVIFYGLVRAPYPSVIFRWLAFVIVISPIGHWVIVHEAATDNIIELLRDEGGLLASLSLAAWFTLLGFGGSMLAARFAGVGQGWLGIVLGASLLLPLGYVLARLGTEPEIHKYGQYFSALQFFLSPDRSSYLSEGALALRYMEAHTFLLALIAFAQYPFWRWSYQGLVSLQRRKRLVEWSSPPTESSTATDHPVPRHWVIGAFSLYLSFLIYGSLVPFDLQPIPFNLAWAGFFAMEYVPTGLGNATTDLPTNILLYIPLTFLSAELLLHKRRGKSSPLGGILLILVCALLLSALIEFVQQFFPSRVMSLRDLLANGLGAAIGLLIWWWRGEIWFHQVSRWRLVNGRADVAEYLLWGYLACLFLYNILPLDLTISPVEIYHKWSRGDVNLIPFGYVTQTTAHFVYNIVTDVAIWVPVSLLWVLSGRKQPVQAWVWSFWAALMLEFFQLLVFSRVSDVTDIITAIIGGGFGALLSRYVLNKSRPVVKEPTNKTFKVFTVFSLTTLWIGLLGVIFWYPFNFEFRRTVLYERIPMLYEVPFQDYFYDTELRAVTGVLRQIILYLPFGVLLGILRMKLGRKISGNYFSALLIFILIFVPIAIELGQIALPEKYPSSGDWLLASSAGVIGFFACRGICRRLRNC
jgi:glycopeptide antibiotics resistance protein